MIRRIIKTALLLLFFSGHLYGQETITIDQSGGCDSIRVVFSLNTALQLSDYTSVKWNFGDGDTASNLLTVSHLYSLPGKFNATCTLNGNRVIQAAQAISVSSSPHAGFTFKDTSLTENEFTYIFRPAYFNPADGDSIIYEWNFLDNSGTTVVTDSTAMHTYPAEGIYQVLLILTNDAGCTDSLYRKVPVSKSLLVPNVFSPNGDMLNDYFAVTTQGDYLYSFRVFTRTGTQIFYSRSTVISWDGRTAGGREVPEGVYYYVIESDDTPESTQVTGFVHLYR